MEAKNGGSPHSWWLESHSKGDSKQSSWLRTTLSELDEKTQTMLKLIEEDADSFAQRAEWYYKKRPELISLVQDFYRAHRSLAERYDLAKYESGNRLLSLTKHRLVKSMSLYELNEKPYDACSEGSSLEEVSDGSEVEDPERGEIAENHEGSQTCEKRVCDDCSDNSNKSNNNNNNEELVTLREEIVETHEECQAQHVPVDSCNDKNDELSRLREEVERLREENKLQKEKLMQKDEEKRHVIRQLSLAMDLLREENVKMGKCVTVKITKRESALELNKLKEHFLGRLFSGIAKP